MADGSAGAAIRDIRREIEQAENAGDAGAFGRPLADDVAMVPADGPRRSGINEVVEFHRDHFDTYDIDVSFDIEKICVVGDLAIERGSYSATLVPVEGGDPRDGGGDYLYVYERQPDSGWQIIRMSW
jgi:uncharacterized protein (TIGR02246 family)